MIHGSDSVQAKEFLSMQKRKRNGMKTQRRFDRLRGHDLKFGEGLKVIGVEGVYPPNPIGLHSGDNLQVEYFAAAHSVAAKQAQQPFHHVRRDRQHAKKSEQAGNRGDRFSGRARLWNSPRIGHDGIKLADYLRGYLKSCGFVARTFKQGARRCVLGGIRVHCIDENVCINEPGLNGHRCKCPVGGEHLPRQGARPAIQDLGG